jgi:hypothetical protein
VLEGVALLVPGRASITRAFSTMPVALPAVVTPASANPGTCLDYQTSASLPISRNWLAYNTAQHPKLRRWSVVSPARGFEAQRACAEGSLLQQNSALIGVVATAAAAVVVIFLLINLTVIDALFSGISRTPETSMIVLWIAFARARPHARSPVPRAGPAAVVRGGPRSAAPVLTSLAALMIITLERLFLYDPRNLQQDLLPWPRSSGLAFSRLIPDPFRTSARCSASAEGNEREKKGAGKALTAAKRRRVGWEDA